MNNLVIINNIEVVFKSVGDDIFMEKTIKKQNEIIKLKSYDEKTKIKHQKTVSSYEKRIAELLDECGRKRKKAVDLAASLVLADEKQRAINAEILNDFMEFQSKIYVKLTQTMRG